MDDIAKKIRSAMRKEKITYTELAQKTGISKSALQRYATGVTGKIPLDRLEMIAQYLNVSPEYLLGWTEQESPSPQQEVPIDSIYRQFKYVTDEIGTLAQIDLPIDGIDTHKTTVAVNKIMEINNAILHTPRLSFAMDEADAVVGLKFILCYLRLDWRKCEDDVLIQLVESELFRDVLKNLLKLYNKQLGEELSNDDLP